MFVFSQTALYFLNTSPFFKLSEIIVQFGRQDTKIDPPCAFNVPKTP
jgi:hypothetical protein